MTQEKDVVTAHLRTVLRPEPAVGDPLRALADGFSLAAVTSGARSRLDACLDVTGRSATFRARSGDIDQQERSMAEGEEDGDLAAAQELVASTDQAELFLYPGGQHLFADSSLASYDEPAATLLMERVLAFLRRV